MGATGAGSNFLDIEQCWFLGHEGLPVGIPKFGGANQVSSGAHGTAVLGGIIAMDNTIPIVGIVPGVPANVISYFDPADAQNNFLATRAADRIVAASPRLMFGMCFCWRFRP